VQVIEKWLEALQDLRREISLRMILSLSIAAIVAARAVSGSGKGILGNNQTRQTCLRIMPGLGIQIRSINMYVQIYNATAFVASTNCSSGATGRAPTSAAYR
jgi:hypothetical protein